MSETSEAAVRICGLCGHEASGFASVWTAATDDVPLCHGDDDPTPTCYERGQWMLVPTGERLDLVAAFPHMTPSRPASPQSPASGEGGGAG